MGVSNIGMPEAKDEDVLREAVDDMLANAERCFRLVRSTADSRVSEKLMKLGRKFEARAGAVREEIAPEHN
jgi:hypothetical protein